MTNFADLTTLRVGGPAAQLINATSESEILAATVSRDLLVIGSGSNLLVSDDGYSGTVLKIATLGKNIEGDACSGVSITLSAGEDWNLFVEYAVSHNFAGVETLAGIPGLIGAAPIQNIGAYGNEIAKSIARVRTFDRLTSTIKTFAAAECAFGYRTSRFKAEPERWIILEVTLQLRTGSESDPIKYQELAEALGLEIGDRAPLTEVRDAVLDLRKRKGMILDPGDRDTWSAGSFFINPIVDSLTSERLPDSAPKWQTLTGIKVSAAWLIEQAGFAKGYRLGGAGISGKHSLALINAENGTAADVITLANHIRFTVHDRFAIWLEPEVRLIGLALT